MIDGKSKRHRWLLVFEQPVGLPGRFPLHPVLRINRHLHYHELRDDGQEKIGAFEYLFSTAKRSVSDPWVFVFLFTT
ncbi:MAG: hypothetical protein KDK75_11770 [Alphaproteobacteria bacterium]|nr:hypothetical protein [Alphaproteobacteria bacterium]